MTTAVQRWGSSGLAALTGPSEGAPDFSRAEVLSRAQQIADRFDVDAVTVLAGRAGLLGLRRRGRVSAGGATRLFAAADGWCAMTLARPEDVDAVPALVQDDVDGQPWNAVTGWAATTSADDVVERAELLDIPVARLGEAAAAPPRIRRHGARRSIATTDLLVVDMSSMWAGPLCTHLLMRLGATVVKVESVDRPDGTRAGDPRFFDWMNAGKLCYAAALDDPALRQLISVADVVIEASRPGVLARHGLGVDDVTARAGRVWLQVTGHGTASTRVAFGDDAAVAGGLVGDGPVFCGDAIADPLTGLTAAAAVADALAAGGGALIDVSMAAVAATYAAVPKHATDADLPAAAPRAPIAGPAASPIGADNAAVERLIRERACAPC